MISRIQSNLYNGTSAESTGKQIANFIIRIEFKANFDKNSKKSLHGSLHYKAISGHMDRAFATKTVE